MTFYQVDKEMRFYRVGSEVYPTKLNYCKAHNLFVFAIKLGYYTASFVKNT